MLDSTLQRYWIKITLHSHYGINFITKKLPKCSKIFNNFSVTVLPVFLALSDH